MPLEFSCSYKELGKYRQEFLCLILFAYLGVVLLVENTDKPRRPANKQSTGNKSTTSRSNASSAGHRDTSGAASRSHSDSKPRAHSGTGRSTEHKTGGSGNRQGQSGPSRQGQSGARPQYRQGQQGQSSQRPAGTNSTQRSSDGSRAPYAKRTPAEAPADKSQDVGDIGLVDDEPVTNVKVHLPKKSDTNYTMSYRGSSQKSAGKSSPNRQNKKNNTGKPAREAFKKQPMLNTHKISPFKYDMNEVLSQSSMDPSMASGFLASVIAKASRISTKEAKDYARSFLDEGNLSKEEYDKICRLMDKYSKYR